MTDLTQTPVPLPEFSELTAPFAGFCLLCERVLEEKDGTSSFIRIIDRWSVGSPLPYPISFYIAVGVRNLTPRATAEGMMLVLRNVDVDSALIVAEMEPDPSLTDFNVVTQVGGLPIMEYGQYRLSVVLSKQEIAFTHFEVADGRGLATGSEESSPDPPDQWA